jgi:hypothetical protein
MLPVSRMETNRRKNAPASAISAKTESAARPIVARLVMQRRIVVRNRNRLSPF